MNEEKKTSIKKFSASAARVVVGVTLFLVILLNYNALTQIDVRSLVESAPSVLVAALTVLGVYFVKSMVFVVPASIIYLSVGMAFPTWQAVIINCVGIFIEVTATYFLGRFIGGETVERMILRSKSGEKLMRFKSKGKYSLVFLMRFLPMPLDFGSLFLGASKFQFFPYISMSLLGALTRVIGFTVLGGGIYEFIPMKFVVIAVLCIIPLVIAAFPIKNAIVRKRSTAQTPDK